MAVSVVARADNKDVGTIYEVTGTLTEVLDELEDRTSAVFNQNVRNFNIFHNGTNISAVYTIK